MHIWVVAMNEAMPFLDGGYRYLRCGLLTQELVKQGHQVTWWNSEFDHMKKRHRFPTSRIINVNGQLTVKLLYGPGYPKNISLKRVLHHHVLARKFKAAAQREPQLPDIVFACLPVPELAAAAVDFGQERNIPVVIDIMDLWPDLYVSAFPEFAQPMARVGLAWEFHKTRRMLSRATGITAVSQTYLKWGLDHANRNAGPTDGVFPLSYQIPTMDTNELHQRTQALAETFGIRKDAHVFLYIGTFGSSYDLETVIQAARILQQHRNDQVQFVIAGGGDNESRIRAMAQGLDNVVFTGWLNQQTLQPMMRLASAGLAPYKHSAFQSLPYKPFEYWSAGLPVLSSLRGELARIIRQHQVGAQYEAHNPQSLVSCIQWFIHPDTDRHQMQANALRLYKERYCAEVVLPALVSHLETVARRNT